MLLQSTASSFKRPEFLFQTTPPSPSLLISVIIPVRNEAANLSKTLHALRIQKDDKGVPLSHNIYEVLLLANNCTDSSFQIAKEYQQTYPNFPFHIAEIYFPKEKAHIGTARRLLMDEAYHRFVTLKKTNGIIASTDGDTEVDATWIHHIIEEINKGNDAVGGRITVKDSGKTAPVYHTLDETYNILIAKTESILDPLDHDPWPRHFQYFGASLAVTCDAYQTAGRMPQLPYLEDEAFYKALFCVDAKIRKSPSIKVITSGRHEGRVAIGLSEQLRKWSQMEKALEPQIVSGAKEIIARITCRCIVRNCWNNKMNFGKYDKTALSSIAKDFLIPQHWLHREFKESKYFGQLWEAIEQKMNSTGWSRKWKPVLITKAILDLQKFISTYD